MKKLLSLLSVIMVGGSATTTIVGCSGQTSTKINITDKITNPLELGTIETPTIKEFLNALQKKIATIKDLSTITTNDYDVYKANSTQFITDQDVKNSDTLQIKIVSKGKKFIGIKDNLKVNFEHPITFQATIYVDEQGNEITSDNHDLSEVKSTKIKQIGFYKNGEAIQAVIMPKTVVEVPEQLPNEITSLSRMFRETTSFNQDISKWDVSKVTNMRAMFNTATSFNQDISNWDVSKVTDMGYVFSDAINFNQDISKWNTSQVTDMGYMFYEAKNFNKDISKWNVSKVTDMSTMFDYAASFNQDISKWNVSNVTDMSSMFASAKNFNKDISKWNVSKVTDMSTMFDYAASFNQDISKWNVSNVTDMSSMFASAKNFNQDVSKWNTSQVKDMSFMFYKAKNFNKDISNWKVSNVTKHEEFSSDSGITDNNFLPKWTTSKS